MPQFQDERMLLSTLLNPTESASRINEDNLISHVDGPRQRAPCYGEYSIAESDTFSIHEAQLEMYKMNTSDKTYTRDGLRTGRNVSAEIYQYSSDTLAKATAPSSSEPIDISTRYMMAVGRLGCEKYLTGTSISNTTCTRARKWAVREENGEFGTRHPDQGPEGFNTVLQSSLQFYTAKFEQNGIPANDKHLLPTEKDEMASVTINSIGSGSAPCTVAPQQPREQLDDDEYEVERVVASRKPRGKQRKYLIKWEGYNEYAWLPRSSLNNALDVLADYHSKRKERRRIRGYA
ncbi:hypothetical protein TWF506_003042 [Arthrobotrys conoides]|uniref:Chromo domain-containing protein n=1 Tax=Arthrobotrys conoides TaxID=74498 RepID=A0AAN8NE00_9PEZI